MALFLAWYVIFIVVVAIEEVRQKKRARLLKQSGIESSEESSLLEKDSSENDPRNINKTLEEPKSDEISKSSRARHDRPDFSDGKNADSK